MLLMVVHLQLIHLPLKTNNKKLIDGMLLELDFTEYYYPLR